MHIIINFYYFQLLIFANLLVASMTQLVVLACIFVIAGEVNYLFLLFWPLGLLFLFIHVFLFVFTLTRFLFTGLSIFFTFIYRSYLCILENYICTLYMCQIYFNILGFKHCLWCLLWHQTFKNHSFLHGILFFLWEIHPIKKKKSIVLLFHLRV